VIVATPIRGWLFTITPGVFNEAIDRLPVETRDRFQPFPLLGHFPRKSSSQATASVNKSHSLSTVKLHRVCTLARSITCTWLPAKEFHDLKLAFRFGRRRIKTISSQSTRMNSPLPLVTVMRVFNRSTV
jgi:hypothetical protein